MNTPEANCWLNVRQRLLWIDCSAGALVGVVVLALHPWLSNLYGLAPGLVLFMGVMNLVYASYSFSLALRRERPLTLLNFLAIANIAWGLLLIYWVAIFAGSASLLGLGYLLLEAVFVGGLGVIEWRSRDLLQTAVVAQS